MLLVGQHPDRFKDASGREQHFAPIAYGAVMLANAARAYLLYTEDLKELEVCSR